MDYLKLSQTRFDVVLVAGQRLSLWPSHGVRVVSSIVSEFGLSVGWAGGADLAPKGVLPSSGTGGTVFAQDVQGRIHRIQGRAIVKWMKPSMVPPPFDGKYCPGLHYGDVAERLLEQGVFSPYVAYAILGSSNRAIRFASRLLERGAPEVSIIESRAQWGAKRYAGWEVERRRFEILGGKWIEGEPEGLVLRGAQDLELKIRDGRGTRVLEVGHVASFGPFDRREPVREYPPGSMLFEFTSSALESAEADSQGWMEEEEHAAALAVRLVKALKPSVGSGKEDLEFIVRRAKNRLRRMQGFQEAPFELTFQGKWLSGAQLRTLKAFPGVPQAEHTRRPVASLECVEDIGCNLCERACPENAIDWNRLKPRKADEPPTPYLKEKDCTACGWCLQACPSSTPILIHERAEASVSSLTFPWRESSPVPRVSETVAMLNRQGQPLGNTRVTEVQELDRKLLPKGQAFFGTANVTIEAPSHLVWEVRGIKRPKAHSSAIDREFLDAESRERSGSPARAEVSLNGERRLVREKISISQALFETGLNRAEDALLCADGSCGLCECLVDGVKKLACRTPIRKGMAIRVPWTVDVKSPDEICHCLGISRGELLERLRSGRLRSFEAVLQATHLGEGKCHGLLCVDAARRELLEAGVAEEPYCDWRFPWTDWKLDPGRLD